MENWITLSKIRKRNRIIKHFKDYLSAKYYKRQNIGKLSRKIK